MKKLIAIISILFITNAKAQNSTAYDRKQDINISNINAKILTVQNDIGILRTRITQDEVDIAQLKIDNAALKKRLDSLKPLIVIHEKSQFNVSDIIKGVLADTVKIQLKIPIR